MTPSLKSLLRAGRFMAVIGLLALSFSEEITGLWLQIPWVLLVFSLMLDRAPQLERRLRRWETLGVAGLVGLTLLDFLILKNSVFVVVAHFLLMLQTLKLVGLKERKDCLQMGLIGFFQFLAACTLSADMRQAILIILLIPGTMALLFWNYAARVQEEAAVKTPWPDRSLKQLHIGLSFAAVPLNIALTMIVFVLFPRLSFNVHIPGFGAGQSAYTDQMNLEQTGTVTRDQSVAAWLGFPDGVANAHWNGYLRGDVLDTFNGKEWRAEHLEKTRVLQPDGNGIFKLRRISKGMQPLHASLTLLNTTKNTLFTPGTPLEITAAFSRLDTTDAGDFHWNEALQHPLQYQILAMPDERQDAPADSRVIPMLYLRLPSQGLARTKTLAKTVAGTGPPAEKAHALEDYLRSHYRYTLDFGQTIPDNPVDYFLFESRQGFCIHFASALAVMLRLENIPSRVVAGYSHGEWNPLARQILFREQDAHAWVEAWVGDHWITLDPSPRATIESALSLRERQGWRRLRETWDYLGYEWNRFIIDYDLYAQLRAWEHLRSSSDTLSTRWLSAWTHWRSRMRHAENASTSSIEVRDTKHARNASPLVIIGVLIALGIGIGLKRSRNNDVPVFYLRFLRRMARLGMEKKHSETAAEFAQRAIDHLPTKAPHIRETTSAYYRLRFGKK